MTSSLEAALSDPRIRAALETIFTGARDAARTCAEKAVLLEAPPWTPEQFQHLEDIMIDAFIGDMLLQGVDIPIIDLARLCLKHAFAQRIDELNAAMSEPAKGAKPQ